MPNATLTAIGNEYVMLRALVDYRVDRSKAVAKDAQAQKV